MSAKIEKRIRALSRRLYNYDIAVWQREEPPKWRFIARRRWKKRKPVYEPIEKSIRKVYK